MVALFDKYVLRTLALVVAFVLCSASAAAQKKHNFNPAKFEADLEQFIASEVGLTPSEASAFFPFIVRCVRSSWLISAKNVVCAM